MNIFILLKPPQTYADIYIFVTLNTIVSFLNNVFLNLNMRTVLPIKGSIVLKTTISKTSF